MSMLDVVNMINSDISNANTTDTESIKRKIDVYSCYNQMAYEMYETTEKAADNYSGKIGKQMEIYSELNSIPSASWTESNKKNFSQSKSDEDDLSKKYKKYSSGMSEIEANYHNEAQKKSASGSEARDIFAQKPAEEYLLFANNKAKKLTDLCGDPIAQSRRTSINQIAVFESCLDSDNSIEFLNIVEGLNTGLEKLRQVRDAKLAGVEYDEDKHIYSFNSHKDFAYVNHPEPQMGLERQYNVGKLKLDEKEKSDDRKKHFDHITAEKELEEKFDARNIGKLLNSKIVLKYLTFNPEEYMALAQEASEEQRQVNMPDRLSNDRAAPVLSAQDGGRINVGDVPLDRVGKGKNVIKYIGEIARVLGIAAGITNEAVSNATVKDVAAWTSVLTNATNIYKQLYDMFNTHQKPQQVGDDDGLADKVINFIVMSAQVFLSTLSTFNSVFINLDASPLKKAERGIVSGAYSIGGDAISIINAIGKVFMASTSIANIKKGMSRVGTVENEDATGSNTQDLRILNAAETAQRKKKSEAYLNATTSGLNLAVDALSTSNVLAKLPALIAKGFIYAANFFGKMAISKYFRADLKNGTWMNVLGMDKDSYNTMLKKMGGNSNIRFRNVIRRKTGLSTREDYAKALLTTDAIDLYAASKAVWVNNKINAANLSSAESRNVDNVMGSIGFSDPKKYDKIKLADICGKLDIDKNWRKTLADSIGKTEIWAEKDEA